MGELQQKMPPGYEVHISYDATEYIQKELDKIYFRTGLTVLILLLLVALITRNLRYLFLIVTSLAVNISVAVILYYAFGLEDVYKRQMDSCGGLFHLCLWYAL